MLQEVEPRQSNLHVVGAFRGSGYGSQLSLETTKTFYSQHEMLSSTLKTRI